MTTVAIDGPGGAGKSTLSRNLAARLGCEWLDTGAMYRCVTLLAQRTGVDPSDGEGLGALARGMDLCVGERVLLGGEDVTAAIRSAGVDAAVSAVSAHPAVRAELVERQRAWVASRGGGIVEGRDITSVVLPDADVKVYLTAGGAERAGRRAGERPGADRAALEEAIATRDALDSGRSASPLVVADGAVVVDSTGRSPEEVLEEVLVLVVAAGGRVDPVPASVPEAGAPSLGTVAPPAPAPPVGAGAGEGAAIRPITASELRFYAVCRAISVGASRLYYPGPVLGAERLPAKGPYVLAPVHRTNLDWLIAARVTRRRLRYIVKDEVWRRSRFAGRLLDLLGAFPVDRDAADREALTTALEVLAAGEPLVVFPEGTRRSGARVDELRDGAAYLALRAGVPIVPVGLGGLEASMPRGKAVPRPVRVAIVVGEPIDPSEVLAATTPGRPARRGRIPRAATKALSERLREGMQSVHDAAEDEAAARRRRGRGASGPSTGG